MTYHRLYPHDVSFDLSVFRIEDATGRLVVREQYANLVCPRCKKLDERRALERGIAGDTTFRTKRNLFGAWDGVYIVSDRLRSLLDDFPESAIDYYAFPKVRGFHVAMPRKVIYP